MLWPVSERVGEKGGSCIESSLCNYCPKQCYPLATILNSIGWFWNTIVYLRLDERWWDFPPKYIKGQRLCNPLISPNPSLWGFFFCRFMIYLKSLWNILHFIPYCIYLNLKNVLLTCIKTATSKIWVTSRLLVYPKCYVYTWQSIDPSLKTIEHYHGLN